MAGRCIQNDLQELKMKKWGQKANNREEWARVLRGV
jgi:hypothetical protein